MDLPQAHIASHSAFLGSEAVGCEAVGCCCLGFDRAGQLEDWILKWLRPHRLVYRVAVEERNLTYYIGEPCYLLYTPIMAT